MYDNAWMKSTKMSAVSTWYLTVILATYDLWQWGLDITYLSISLKQISLYYWDWPWTHCNPPVSASKWWDSKSKTHTCLDTLYFFGAINCETIKFVSLTWMWLYSLVHFGNSHIATATWVVCTEPSQVVDRVTWVILQWEEAKVAGNPASRHSSGSGSEKRPPL